MDKDIQMKIRQNNEWVNIMPKTKAKNVILSNGKNLEQYMSEISKNITDLKNTYK